MKRFNVSLVGEINLDLIFYGLAEDIPLEREVLAEEMEMVIGGSPAITAHNLAALGAKVGLISQLSEGPLADLLTRQLRNASVDLSAALPARRGVRLSTTVLLQHQASRRAISYTGSAASLTLDQLDLDYLSDASHFHLSSYFLQEQLRGSVPALFRTLRSRGLTISMDTNDDPSDLWFEPTEELLGLVDVLMPNEREALRLAREDSLDAAIARLSKLVPVLVIKRGEEGATVVSRGARFDAPAVPVTPLDVVGAGDSFNAGFLHAFAQGAGLDACARLGNACGALSTTAPGGTAAFQSAATMRRFLEDCGVDSIASPAEMRVAAH